MKIYRAVQGIFSCSSSKIHKLVKKAKHYNFFFLNLQISVEILFTPSLWGQAR